MRLLQKKQRAYKRTYRTLTEHQKMPLVSLCPKERSAELVQEGLTKILAYCEHLEKTNKELTEQLKLSEDKVKELTHQNDDYDDLVPDGVECETFAWIEDRLAKMDVMEEVKDDLENKVLHLESENEELEKEKKMLLISKNKLYHEVEKLIDSEDKQTRTEQVYYHGEPLKCIEDGTPITISDVFPNKLKEENMELSKKSNAKSDIIRNMFDFITEDPEEVQEGFTFKRDWGNKYIDEWNKIVTDEFKEVIKDINEQSPDDEMEWKTDGYDFSLHIREESDSEDEEVVQGSKVDMEAFKKLKEDGMMPWAK